MKRRAQRIEKQRERAAIRRPLEIIINTKEAAMTGLKTEIGCLKSQNKGLKRQNNALVSENEQLKNDLKRALEREGIREFEKSGNF